MRIAHVTDCYLPRLGGIEMQVHDLAARQREAGHGVEIFTATPAAEPRPGTTHTDPDWVHRFGSGTDGTPLRSFTSTRLARGLFTEGAFDAIHVHVSVVSPFATAAAIAATRAGLPTVVTVHSLLTGLGPLPWLADSALRLRDLPVVWTAVSDKAAIPLRRAFGHETPVAVLPNGIDADAWRVGPGHRSAQTVTVVSVMRLAARKRPIALLRMMRRVRDTVSADMGLRLVIVGDGPLFSALRRYLRRHDMTEWVTLTGRLSRREICDIFASSDLYVAPAELESFGIAALEARSAGLPVVASSRGGVDAFITHGREGLLAGSDAQMVDALVTMIERPDLRNSISTHNRVVAPAVGWSAVLDRAGQLYAEAAVLSRGVGTPQTLRTVGSPTSAVSGSL